LWRLSSSNLATKVLFRLCACFRRISAQDSGGNSYAIKVAQIERGLGEKKTKSTTQSDGAIGLAVERRVYEVQLRGLPGVPSLPPRNYGDSDGYRYLVMQAMSNTLKDRVKTHGALSSQASAYVATKLVRRFPRWELIAQRKIWLG
jgi:hypothetical protein